jgi:hypothetical protein
MKISEIYKRMTIQYADNYISETVYEQIEQFKGRWMHIVCDASSGEAWTLSNVYKAGSTSWTTKYQQ